MADLAQRFPENPILRPSDIGPSTPGMQIECLLNPGVFRFEGKTWLLLRVAERPVQKPGKTSFPVLDEAGILKILEFDNADPLLDLSDPRVISYAGQDYLTTMSHLRLVASDDGVHFRKPRPNPPLFGQGELESYGIEDCRVVEIDGTLLSDVHPGLAARRGRGPAQHPRLAGHPLARHDLSAAQQGLRDLPRADRRAVTTPCTGPAARNWAATTSGSPSRPT